MHHAVKQHFVKVSEERRTLFHDADQQAAVADYLVIRIAFHQPAAVALEQVELLVDLIGFLHKNNRVHVTFRPKTIEYQTLLGEFRYFFVDGADLAIAHGDFGFEVSQLTKRRGKNVAAVLF